MERWSSEYGDTSFSSLEWFRGRTMPLRLHTSLCSLSISALKEPDAAEVWEVC